MVGHDGDWLLTCVGCLVLELHGDKQKSIEISD